jgi:hypothetical protein
MFRLSLQGGNGDIFQFHDFFHLFVDYDLSTTRECLLAWLYQANKTVDEDGHKISDNEFLLLAGEQIKNTVDKARWVVYTGGKTKDLVTYGGKCYITNYRICLITFFPNRGYRHSYYDVPPFFDRMNIPLSTIYKIQNQEKKTISILTKDNRFIRIQILSSKEDIKTEILISKIMKDGCMESKHDTLTQFAFAYKFAEFSKNNFKVNGWQFNEIRREYMRQGLDDSNNWKV